MEEKKGNNIPINQWDNMDKPREKLMAKGREALSDAELIAILLGSGSRDQSAVELARNILKDNENNLNTLAALSLNDLMKYKGIGEAKAISIVAALELGRRRRQSEVIQKKKISSSKDAYELLIPKLDNKNFEEFWVLFLSRSNTIMSMEKISSGGLTASIVDPRKIFKLALDKLSSSMILAHNHPSGNLKPSDSDIKITQKIKSGAEIFDLSVLDHLIIGDGNYYSFADNGIM